MSQEIFEKKPQKWPLGAEHPPDTPCFELPEQIASAIFAASRPSSSRSSNASQPGLQSTL
jgi:hypothetical protein